VGSPKPRFITPLAQEDEVIQLIRDTLGNGIEQFALRDDAAVLDVPAGSPLVASVDSVVGGVHVDLALCSPGDVGWKALMGALSDLAAMGAEPFAALVGLCVPERSESASREEPLALGVMRGVAEASAASGCPVAGGDLSSSSELVVAVTVLGTLPAARRPVPRSGARAGDTLLVTGPCGASAAGLRVLREGGGSADALGPRSASQSPDEDAVLVDAYRRPLARLREGQLARAGGAHAMIDISDGFALDLHRMADASGIGFELDDVPVAPGATLDEALGGGEDYELALALHPSDVDGLVGLYEEAGLRRPVLVGSAVADGTRRCWRGQPLERAGWQHRVG
jgi:thiamine-monophosphate kinase